MTKATLLMFLSNVPDDEEIGIIDDQGKELDIGYIERRSYVDWAPDRFLVLIATGDIDD